MFVYTVRIELPSDEQLAALLRWLDEGGHLADVVRAGALEGEAVVLDDPARVVECRYLFASREAFAEYEAGPAEALRAEGRARFGPETGVRMSRSTGTQRAIRRAE